MVTIGVYLFLLWAIALSDRPGGYVFACWVLSMIVVFLVSKKIENKL